MAKRKYKKRKTTKKSASKIDLTIIGLIVLSILLCVLIYVGIRMAISTVASDKAAYKKMLVDWACSLALIFLLQYIILLKQTIICCKL